jgi:hypothetical protein
MSGLLFLPMRLVCFGTLSDSRLRQPAKSGRPPFFTPFSYANNTKVPIDNPFIHPRVSARRRSHLTADGTPVFRAVVLSRVLCLASARNHTAVDAVLGFVTAVAWASLALESNVRFAALA